MGKINLNTNSLCITSITPTICKLMGIKTPSNSDGKIIQILAEETSIKGITSIKKCLIFSPDAIGSRFYHDYVSMFKRVLQHTPDMERPLSIPITEDSLVIVIDNMYVEGNSTPICRTDEPGNTYQIRELENGSKYEVLKNFPNQQELNVILTPYTDKIQYTSLKYYWLLKHKLRKTF